MEPQPPSLVLMGKNCVVQIKRMVRNDRKISYYPKILFPNMTPSGISFGFLLLLLFETALLTFILTAYSCFSVIYVLYIHSAADSCFQVFMTKGFYEHSCYLLMVVVMVVMEEKEDICKSSFGVYD